MGTMKLFLPLVGVLFLTTPIHAIPYTEIYDVFQGGYDGGDYDGILGGTIRITDIDEDGFISEPDLIIGSLIFRREHPLYLRGFDIIGITGSSLLSGEFCIIGLSHLGGTATITNTGGSAVNFAFPVTGQFSVTSSTQTPVVTKRVSDGGSTGILFIMGLFISLRRLLSSHQ